MNKMIRSAYFLVRRAYYTYILLARNLISPKIFVVNFGDDAILTEDLEQEFNFHFGRIPQLTYLKGLPLHRAVMALLLGHGVVTLGKKYRERDRAWLNVFNIDVRHCHVAAWSWHQLLLFVSLHQLKDELSSGETYRKFCSLYGARRNGKAYVFGTGPSLINCLEMDFREGIRIACNTMVKSDRIWSHLRPQIVVAGDAIHHFSNTNYACAFRRDLKRRLLEDRDLRFFYPADFHPFVRQEFAVVKEQLMPMAHSSNTDPFRPFRGHLTKAANENVLTMLQLPLAANLAMEIDFLGFDGRGKADAGFWKSSDEYNYIDEMPQLRGKYPAFFHYYLEANKDKNAYVQKVHGEALERYMQTAERAGYVLRSLADSNTETFKKRYSAF